MAARWRSLAILALACTAGLRLAGAADDDPAALMGLLASDEASRAAAVDAWKALAPAAQAAAVRAGLGSARADVAHAAAVVASPWWLDADDLERWSRAISLQPLARFLPPPGWGDVVGRDLIFGSQDLPALWRAIGANEDAGPAIGYESLHRCLAPAHVPALVALLPAVGPEAFPALAWDVLNQAQQAASDAQHDLYVKAFRYTIQRLQAAAAGRPVPRWEDVPEPAPRLGIPAAALELVRAAWPAPGEGRVLLPAPQAGSAEARRVAALDPGLWLARWLRRTTPAESDLDVLLEIAQLPHAPMQARWWAGRQAARFEGRAAGRVMAQILAAGGGDDAALGAAAEAAARGRPEAWRSLDHDPPPGVRWLADPARAAELAWRALASGELPSELEGLERAFDAYDLGIDIPRASLDDLAARVRAGGAPPRAELAFLARVMPEAMTAADALRIVERWMGAPRVDASGDEDLRKDLAALEVRAPGALVLLLRRWADAEASPEGREAALALLARLGDTALAEAMAATLPSGALEARHVARVRSPAIEAGLRALLEASTAAGDLEREAEAVEALAIFAGCPEPLAGYLGPAAIREDAAGRATYAEARALVLAGDPVGAVLLQTRAGTTFSDGSIDWVAGFGRSRDPRVAERLRGWRQAAGSGLYWPATAALALQGDVQARTEWERFLRSARTFLIEDLQCSALCTLDGDPALVSHWIEMLGTNCCLAWNALEVLGPLLPTAPLGDVAAGDGGRACATARAWHALHGPHLAPSRLLDGLVPGPR